MTNSFPKADTCGVALETSLAEARRFLQSTLDALSTHIAILDEHGTIIGVNAAWRTTSVADSTVSAIIT